jgi:tryptophan synthase alpha chain
MTAVTTAFEKAAAEGRAALVGYLPAGFPSVDGAIAAATAMAESGCDVLEIGLPYSDPLMDGPVIQEATHRALAAGTRVTDVLRTVEAVAGTGVPLLVMTYWNPVDHYGVASFAADLASAGGAGLITPDLPPEEAGDWLAASDEYGLDRVFLVAPSSTLERIRTVTAACRGFVYAASLMGITGTRAMVSDQAAGLVGKVRECTRLPVAVGLGVRDGAQAAEVARFADGVIVGSAFVQRLLNAPTLDAGVRAVRDLAADLAAGVRAAQPRAAQPRAAQPRAAQPRAAQPRAAQPRAAQPTAAQPSAGS